MTALEPYKDTLSQPDVIREAWSLAGKISTTEFVPKSLRGSTEKVMAALLAGRELGLGPMTALAHVHIVEGRPALSAESKQALAVSAGHTIDVVETNTEKCVVIARRAGSDRDVKVEWTMKDAQAAGLANKDNWKKHPRRMLQARATAEAVRLIAPDTTLGIPLTVEEAEDLDEPAPAQQRTVRRKVQATVSAGAAQHPANGNGHSGRVVSLAPPAPAELAETTTAVTDDGEVIDVEVVEDAPLFDPDTPRLMRENQRSRIFAIQKAAKLSTDEVKAVISDVTGGRTDSRARDGGVTDFEADEIIARLDQIEVERRTSNQEEGF